MWQDFTWKPFGPKRFLIVIVLKKTLYSGIFPSDKKPVLCLCLLVCLSICLSIRLFVIRFIWIPFIQIGVCTIYLLTLTEASPADHLLFSLTCVYVPITCILQVSVFVCCKKKVSFSFINFKYHFNSQ